MIEVEIRGPLTESEAVALKEQFSTSGKHLGTKEREMILLRGGYPGFDTDPTKRATDIRLKRTNGKVEVVVKHKLSDGNVGRSELIIPLTNDDLGSAKKLAVAFGANKGLWMRRVINVYVVDGIEWSITEAIHRTGSPILYLYEAEMTAAAETDIPSIREQLFAAARKLNLEILETDVEMRDFIRGIDTAVNEEIDLTL